MQSQAEKLVIIQSPSLKKKGLGEILDKSSAAPSLCFPPLFSKGGVITKIEYLKCKFISL